MPKIAVLCGDGIGREIVPEAVKVLKTVSKKYSVNLEFTDGLISEDAYDKFGHPLPDETLHLCRQSDAVLLGAVGSPRMDKLPPELRPERAALLALRKKLGLFANLRPIFVNKHLLDASSLKPEIIRNVDILFFRELTGGLYFGDKHRSTLPNGEEQAVDTLVYSTSEIERIVRLAFKSAIERRQKVTLVDKANILESSRLWREIATKIAAEYQEIEFEAIYVDNCAMQLIRNPQQFDVIVTENMFGDILTDQGSMLAGSLGLLPSASLGGSVSLYEPVHGSAPDIAGQNIANPLATILSGALMLRHSFGNETAANAIENAVNQVLDEGFRTSDIFSEGNKLVSTDEMGTLVCEHI